MYARLTLVTAPADQPDGGDRIGVDAVLAGVGLEPLHGGDRVVVGVEDRGDQLDRVGRGARTLAVVDGDAHVAPLGGLGREVEM